MLIQGLFFSQVILLISDFMSGRNTICSSIISRLVKDVVSVSSDTLTPEHSREAQTLRNLILRNLLVTTFRLTNDEFADL